MVRYLSLLVVILAAALVACSENNSPPPTKIVVISPQPTQEIDPTQIALQVTVEALQATNITMNLTLAAIQSGNIASPAPSDTTIPASATPDPNTLTPVATETPRPSGFPTHQVELVSIVEQVFERGRMIWFRENRMVWVLIGDELDPSSGEWLCFIDTFQEGDIEFLPTFEPPAGTVTQSTFTSGNVQQPIRGFGKIWRENNLYGRLGWALTSEVEHSGTRTLVAGGALNPQGTYVPGPNEWRVQSIYNEVLLLYEKEMGMLCPAGTWKINRVP